MASGIHGIWAVDIGDNALKALRLRRVGESFEVVGFDYIEHSKILSGGNVTEGQREDIIADTLHQFVEKNDLGKDEVAISIAGHNSFARFVKLPPVDKKIIPKIIPQEAVQQIPFDINEVEWDWQLMESSDSPDVMLGIFAIKNEVINSVIERFTRENISVTCVQISPMALYNYAMYDRVDVKDSGGKPTIVIDMGAENTTLVVCTKSGVWQRSIRIGGNAFTEAIAEAFKLRFQKAEKLKRTAPTSKYIRQIFTAMRPVFTDLGSEIQRSLGFYSSSGPGRDKGFSKVIALGGGMKLQGLAKYLQQTLGLAVVKPDSFEKLSISPEVSSAKFHENISDFAVVYGLAVQLLEEATITGNLLPRRIARATAWRRKGRFFTIAASVMLLVSVLSFARASHERGKYARGARARGAIRSAISTAQNAGSSLAKERGKDSVLEKKIRNEMDYFMYRDVVPLLNETIIRCLPDEQNNSEQAQLYEAFYSGNVDEVVSFIRNERKQLFVTYVSVDYAESLASAEFGQTKRTTAGKSQSTQMATGRMDRMDMMSRRFSRLGGRGPAGGDAKFAPTMGRQSGTAKAGKDKQGTGKDNPGFVVVIEGYSPYKNINELLDPSGVGNDQSKWGLVTRFENLAAIIPGSQFELFEKNNVTHFKCDTGEVQIGLADMPVGIGVEKEVERAPAQDQAGARLRQPTYGLGSMDDRLYVEKVLVDPMTNEEMSKTFDLITEEDINVDPGKTERDLGKKEYTDFGQPKYLVRDHWFRVQVKFSWKGLAKPEKESGPGVITSRKLPKV
jgi:type IV pilus assembly protein PilM